MWRSYPVTCQVAVSIAVTDLLRECKNTRFVWDLSKGFFCEGAVRLLVKSFHYALNLKLFDYSSVDWTIIFVMQPDNCILNVFFVLRWIGLERKSPKLIISGTVFVINKNFKVDLIWTTRRKRTIPQVNNYITSPYQERFHLSAIYSK